MLLHSGGTSGQGRVVNSISTVRWSGSYTGQELYFIPHHTTTSITIHTYTNARARKHTHTHIHKMIGRLTNDGIKHMKWRRRGILQHWPGEAEETNEKSIRMFRQRFELYILRIQARNIKYGNAIMCLFKKGGMTWNDFQHRTMKGFHFASHGRGKYWDNLQCPGLLTVIRQSRGSTNVSVRRPNRRVL